jgi:hypothetical protein
MSEDRGAVGFADRKPQRGLATFKETKQANDEAYCAAFGYVRGLEQRAVAVEFRFRDGNSDWFAYSLLGAWRYNPSVGLLLKFAGGDLITYVLIRGSNLDAVLREKEINLTDRGFQRHRITFVREMDEDELRKAGEGEPTIDRLEVVEFESNEEALSWLEKTAPAFLRRKN